MYYRPHLVSLLMLIAFSCEFVPEGEVFTEVSPPITSDISIEIPATTNDTIFLSQPAELSYRSILGVHQANLVRVSFDGEEIVTSARPAGSFNFYTPNYPSGIHRLTIELHATGGSGSLADSKGKEEIVIKKDYTLSIDLEVPDAVAFTSMNVEDGFLKVSWEKYQRKNFERYLIYKYCYSEFTKRYETCWYKQLSNQDVTSLTDSSFIGGTAQYRIAVRGADQVGPFSEQEVKVAYDPQLTWQWLNNEELQLKWQKPACYASFTSYELAYGPYYEQETITVGNLADTTLIIKPGLKFATYMDLILTVNPYRINTYNTDYVVGRARAYLGTRFPSFFRGSVLYNQPLNKYLIVRPKDGAYELVRVNAEDYHEEQRLSILTQNISLSANGAHLCFLEGKILKKIDPVTFATISTFDLSTLESGTAWTFNVSDNNILVANNYGGTYVVDMSDFHLIQKLASDFSTLLSADGQFLARRNEILALENGQYASKMSLPESLTTGRQFIANDKLLLPARGTLLLVDLSTFSVVNKTLVEGAYQGYDPVSGMASSVSTEFDVGPRRLFLYSLDMKEAITGIEIAGNVRLMNNSLIADGLITPLSSYYP